jgi:hypothetical protein
MGRNLLALKWFAIVNKWPHGSVPMLKFDKQWRFDSPCAIPGAVINSFQDFIGIVANQGSEKAIYEHLKSYFGGAAGISSGWSSRASWAQSDLCAYMDKAGRNAPLFIEAFYDACNSLVK